MSPRWALIEPPSIAYLGRSHKPEGSGRRRFRVVLAHPERKRRGAAGLAFLESCASSASNFQLTTGSLLGRMVLAQATANAILRRAPEWQIVIASTAITSTDAHRT